MGTKFILALGLKLDGIAKNVFFTRVFESDIVPHIGDTVFRMEVASVDHDLKPGGMPMIICNCTSGELAYIINQFAPEDWKLDGSEALQYRSWLRKTIHFRDEDEV